MAQGDVARRSPDGPLMYDVRAFGARGDGVTDDTAAIQAAITAAGATYPVFLPPGTYIISPLGDDSLFLSIPSGCKIIGSGIGSSILKVKNSAGTYWAIFRAYTGGAYITANDCCFRDFTVDCNQPGNPLNTAVGGVDPRRTFDFGSGDRLTFERVEVRQMDGRQIIYSPIDHTRVNGCIFREIGNPAYVSGSIDHTSVYLAVTNAIITNNIFEGILDDALAPTAIDTHTQRVVISGNIVRNYGKGFNLTGQQTDGDSTSQIVTGNVLEGVSFGIYFWSATYGAHLTGFGLNGLIIANNSIQIAQYNWGESGQSAGIRAETNITLPVKNIIIEGNSIVFAEDNGSARAELYMAGIACRTDASASLYVENIRIANNIIENCPLTGIFLNSAFKTAVVSDNLISNCGYYTAGAAPGSYRTGIMVTGDGTFIKGLNIDRNTIVDSFDVTKLTRGIYIIPTGSPTGINVRDNTILLTGADKSAFLRHYDLSYDTTLPFVQGRVDEAFVDFGKNVLLGSRFIDYTNLRIIEPTGNNDAWKYTDYGTEAPTSGTWTRGSVRWNTTPSAGQPIGWICVTAGTPGTWRAFGGIEDVAGTLSAGRATMVDSGGVTHKTVFTFTLTGAEDLDLADGDHGIGKQFFQFPQGRISILGATIDAVVTPNTAFNATPNDTFKVGIGTVTAADDNDLTGTEQDIIPATTLDTNSGSGAAIDWHAALASGAQFDGTTTGVKLFANVACADANNSGATTYAITGTLTVVWTHLGDY